MKKNKALGPDGFTVEFYLCIWDSIGNEFCNAIMSFFDTSILHPGVNSISITSVSKVCTPTQMKDFRAITFCSIPYKCIAKIIANGMKIVLPNLIKVSKFAFIPGHSILDNILMDHELFRGYNRKTGSPKCALKVDLHNAFDSISWAFIMKTLEKMNFPQQFRSWIYACISISHFSVKVNGALLGYFPGAKGLR